MDLKAKISGFFSDAYPLWLMVVAGLGMVIGILSFIMGLESVFGIIGGHAPDRNGTWSLIVMSFFSGLMYQKYQAEIDEHNPRYPAESEGDKVRTLIGFALFCFTWYFSTDLTRYITDTTWDAVMRGLPSALLAWGAYCMIIQVPWGTSEKAKAQKAANPKKTFGRVYLEQRKSEHSPWVSIQTVEGELAELSKETRLKANTLKDYGPETLRVTVESISRETSYIRGGQ